MEKILRSHIKKLVALLALHRGCGVSTLGKECKKDSMLFARLDDETKSFTVKTYDEIVQWFSDVWPDDLKWPEIRFPDGVYRPEVTKRRKPTKA